MARRRSRTQLLAALALAVAVAAAWSAVSLIERPSVPVTSGGAAGPESLPSFPTQPSSDAIDNVRMFSRTDGWAERLIDGAILHTNQGVKRWQLSTPATLEAVIAVAYVNSETARALTLPAGASDQTVIQSWSTSDGGDTWRAQGTFAVESLSPDMVGSLDFTDPEHGWFSQIEQGPEITGTALFRTVDGGAHWSEVIQLGTTGLGGSPDGRGVASGCVELTAVFISDTDGWITGTCAIGPPPLYVTHDGGLTWAEQNLPRSAGGLYSQTSFPPRFTSAEDGTLITEDAAAAPVSADLFSTMNGGATWSLRHFGAGIPVGADFLDADRGWLVIEAASGDPQTPDLYATSDAGQSWSLLGAFPSPELDLDFLNATTGWASTNLDDFSGGTSYLLSTSDGGRSWTGLRPQISAATTAG